MSALNHSDSSNEPLDKVLEIINELAKKSVGGNYIYRGECEDYDKVSSNLYRQCHEICPDEEFDMEFFQSKKLEESKRYTLQTDERKILSQIQHFGGDTNLIDFTTDYLIALFFACDGDAIDKNGRVILLQNSNDANKRIWRPHTPENRVIAQKSVFVQPKKGYLEQDEFQIIDIPHSLKKSILEHLRKSHGISRATIYNDLHGYIKNQDIHKEAYENYLRGVVCQKRRDYDKAIEYYSKTIQLKPDFVEAYNNRGDVYAEKHDRDQAIQNYNKAIELSPNFAEAYNNRGVIYLWQSNFELHKRELAKQDFTKAIEFKPDCAETYVNLGNVYRGMCEYERAIEYYDKAIGLKLNNAYVYYFRGDTYYKKGDRDRALEDLKRAEALAEEQGLSDLLRRIQLVQAATFLNR